MSALKTIAIFLGKLVGCVVLMFISSIWTSLVLFNLTVAGFKSGFRKLFYYKDRCNLPPPAHYTAWDNETRHNPGPDTKPWNHAYVTVPDTGLRFHYVYTGKIPSNLSISDIDGETVKVQEKDDANDSKPELMLCLHGFPENWFSWRHILRHFEKRPGDKDYFVVAVDLRGYGDSDKPKGKMAYHIKGLVGDVKGIVHSLGYEKCILLAHDWGGVLGWRVAEVYPDIVKKYIALNAPPGKEFRETALRNPRQIIFKSWYMYFYQMPFLPEYTLRMGDFKFISSAFNGSKMGIKEKKNRLTEKELEVFKYSLRNSLTPAINYYRAMLWPFCQPGPPSRYPKTRTGCKRLHAVPILLLWGDQDGALIKEIAERTRSSLNPENGSKVVFIEGASHWVQQDRPEEVIEQIEEFLN